MSSRSKAMIFSLLVSLGLGRPAIGAVTHFVSFGMPSALLRETLKAAGQSRDDRVLFRGFPEGKGYRVFIDDLLPYLRDLPKDQRPRIGIDPHAFEAAGIHQVPVMEHTSGLYTQKARYTVTEKDPRHQARERLAQMTRSEWVHRLLQTPMDVPRISLSSATTGTKKIVNPLYRLPRPLKGTDGKIIVPEGQTANPLSFFASGVSALIFDPHDARQLDAVLQRMETHPKGMRLLATGRAPGFRDPDRERLSKRLNVPIFPVPSAWLKRLEVNALPALVESHGASIEVTQWPP